MIISREEFYTAPQVDGRTSCSDETACEVLNEILNGTPEQRLPFSFKVDSSSHNLTLVINTSRMAHGEMMDLNMRVMKFLMSEINDVRNGD